MAKSTHRSGMEADAHQTQSGHEGCLLAEYSALRQEILARSQTQSQLVNLAFVVTGTLLTLNLAHQVSREILLVLPILPSTLVKNVPLVLS